VLIEQAVILAGGLGTRLGELSSVTPKPLVEVAGRPFLEHLIWNLKRYGIKEILLLVGHLANRIQDHFGTGEDFGVHIEYAFEEKPAGTGGALLLARAKLADLFLLTNGDTLFDINYLDLELAHNANDSLVTIALRSIEDASRYGTVEVLKDKITGFHEKKAGGAGLINGGVYCIAKKSLDLLQETPSSIESDLFPLLASKGELSGKKYGGYFIDIGTPDSLQEGDVSLRKWRKKPTVFFDRDGVLNIDKGYVHKPDDFEWIEGAREAVKWANDNGYLAIVITNQAGIARGYYTEEHFLNFTQWINDELRKSGAHLDATYYCPHHPREGKGKYLFQCKCRKPGSGMLIQAIDDWGVDTGKSIMVGDKEKDVLAAKGAGVEGVIFDGNDLESIIKKRTNFNI